MEMDKTKQKREASTTSTESVLIGLRICGKTWKKWQNTTEKGSEEKKKYSFN